MKLTQSGAVGLVASVLGSHAENSSSSPVAGGCRNLSLHMWELTIGEILILTSSGESELHLLRRIGGGSLIHKSCMSLPTTLDK